MASQDTLFVPKVTPLKATWVQVANDYLWKGRNPLYVQSTNVGNAYTITLPSPSLVNTLQAGDSFQWHVNATNTGASTLTVVGASTIGPTDIVSQSIAALTGGELTIGNVVNTVFNGAVFIIAYPTGGTILPSATTSQLYGGSGAANAVDVITLGPGLSITSKVLNSVAATAVVDSITALKALLKTGVPTALVTGYYTQGDGGGGTYWYDSTDTTSADNGGTIIVATDGGRWKLSTTGRISVKQFGAVGDGAHATQDTAAVTAIITYFEGLTIRGGIIYFPRGTYNITSRMSFVSDATTSGHNIWIEGDGRDNTTLDFTGNAGNGIQFSGGFFFGVRDLSIQSAGGNGLVINQSGLSATVNCAFFDLSNLSIHANGASGLLTNGAYLFSCDNVRCDSNTTVGFNFSGYTTTANVRDCEASSNGTSGYAINNLTYSTFSGCGSDTNEWGYSISNASAVNFTACGAEANLRDGFYLFTSNVAASGASVPDIHGVVFDSCFSNANDTSTHGSYGNFMGALSGDSRPIDFIVKGGSALTTNAADVAFHINGASGQINFSKEGFYPNGFTAADSIAGTVYLGEILSALGNYTNDAGASAGGVPVQGMYRNGSILMVRVV